jgi:hypothetical protein
MHSLFRLALIAGLCTLGCESKPLDPPASEEIDGGFDSPPDAGPAARDSELDVESYALRGAFDWNEKALNATVRVTLAPNNAGRTELSLDSSVKVSKVAAPDGSVVPFVVNLEKNIITISLTPASRQADGRTIVDLWYRATEPLGDDLRGLNFYGSTKGDPNQARAVYTFSEPTSARSWMPCHDAPKDRAVFSAEISMPEKELLISNGELKSNTVAGGIRTMRYQTSYTLPTYLMALAVGEFEVERAKSDSLPIAVWHRKGLAGDYVKALSTIDVMIKQQAAMFQTPYPFEKYDLVLLPGSIAGIEHAGISFQGEMFSSHLSLAVDYRLTAHEIAHQWWGNLVTIDSWDDYWIKEGLASVVETEFTRSTEDLGGSKSLLGNYFELRADEAAFDTALPAEQKANNGTYPRAGWIYSQIRQKMGDALFWKTIKTVIDNHRFGSIGTEAFLRYFLPGIGAEGVTAFKRALISKKRPALQLKAEPDGSVEATLADPEGVLIEPFTLVWISANGSRRPQTIPVGTPTRLKPQDGELLVEDPTDTHPRWTNVLTPNSQEGFVSVAQWQLPQSEALLVEFLKLPGSIQREALRPRQLPPAVTAANFAQFFSALNGSEARLLALNGGCVLGAADPSWKSTLTTLIRQTEPLYRAALITNTLAECEKAVDLETLFSAEWSVLEKGASPAVVDEPMAQYLTLFTLPETKALSVWGNVAKNGYSVRLREAAVSYLAKHPRISPLSEAIVPQWRSTLIDIVKSSEIIPVLNPTFLALTRVVGKSADENKEVRAALVELLKNRQIIGAHFNAACLGFLFSNQDLAVWQAFQASAGGANASPPAQVVFADPVKTCFGG